MNRLNRDYADKEWLRETRRPKSLAERVIMLALGTLAFAAIVSVYGAIIVAWVTP